jgi:hypothetical protein
MTCKAVGALVGGLGLYLLASQGALAAAMQCSTEAQACIAKCPKFTNASVTTNCVTNCRTRRSMCMQTGCWSNGRTRFCGLARR